MAVRDNYTPEAYALLLVGNRARNKAYRLAHPERSRAQQRKWRNKSRERVNQVARDRRQRPEGKKARRNNWLEKMYGISLEDYNAIFEQQGGLCFICHRPEVRRAPNGEQRALSVDHDHTSGMLRSLLCHDCNVSLGLLGESPDRCRAAAAYLEMFKRQEDGK